MKLNSIHTDRYFQNWPSWHLIYEWEDIIILCLGLQLVDSRKAYILTNQTDRALRYLSRKVFKSSNKLLPLADKLIHKKTSLYFEIFPKSAFYFSGSKNTIPVIIDFWKTIDLDSFYQAYKNCRLVLISSIEVYNFLKERNLSLNFYHFPLSLPDKYLDAPVSANNKIYDIVIPGRGNRELWKYLLEYEKKFPWVEYLYQKQIAGELYYCSNKKGLVGKFQSREEYINLLYSAKVSFYSTPGIDGDENRTGGFSPVTPRFLEMIAAGCKVIARYPKNAETKFYEMDEICVSCDDYSIFEAELSKALETDFSSFTINKEYLSGHSTSARAELLKSILSRINQI